MGDVSGCAVSDMSDFSAGLQRHINVRYVVGCTMQCTGRGPRKDPGRHTDVSQGVTQA